MCLSISIYSKISKNYRYGAVHILRQPPEVGGGVSQKLTIADEGSMGVSQMLTIADKGGCGSEIFSKKVFYVNKNLNIEGN